MIRTAPVCSSRRRSAEGTVLESPAPFDYAQGRLVPGTHVENDRVRFSGRRTPLTTVVRPCGKPRSTVPSLRDSVADLMPTRHCHAGLSFHAPSGLGHFGVSTI